MNSDQSAFKNGVYHADLEYPVNQRNELKRIKVQTDTYVPARVRREEIAALNALWIAAAVGGLILFVTVLIP